VPQANRARRGIVAVLDRGRLRGLNNSWRPARAGRRGRAAPERCPTDAPGSVDTRGFYVNGVLNEIHLVVSRALSDAEIQAIVTAGS